MFRYEDLLLLRRDLRGCDYCDELTEQLFQKLYDAEPEEYLVVEEWQDLADKDQTYADFVGKAIEEDLADRGVSFVVLANSSGQDKTFIHYFALFQTEDSIVRLEAYGRQPYGEVGTTNYRARLVEWPTYQEDLTKLLGLPTEAGRLQYWNGLFSSTETQDTYEPIDVILLRLPV